MITIGLDPNIATIGPFTIAWHGLLTALAVVVGVWVSSRYAPSRGIAADDIYSAALWAVPAGIVGARLFHVVDQWEFYLAHPLSIFALNSGGLAIYGAVIGGTVGVLAFVRIKRIRFWPVMDVATPGLLVAQVIGRAGCLLNGDSYGAITDFPFAIVYTHPNAMAPINVPTHAFPIYEILWNLAALGLIWGLRRRLRPDGMMFLGYGLAYGLGRFGLTFIRDNEAFLFGLRQAHVISILVVLAVIPTMIYLRSRPASAALPVRVGPSRAARRRAERAED